jgi:hypothetical protein
MLLASNDIHDHTSSSKAQGQAQLQLPEHRSIFVLAPHRCHRHERQAKHEQGWPGSTRKHSAKAAGGLQGTSSCGGRWRLQAPAQHLRCRGGRHVCPPRQIPSHPLTWHRLLRPTARAPWQGEEAIFAHAVSRRGTCALPGRHLLRRLALGAVFFLALF